MRLAHRHDFAVTLNAKNQQPVVPYSCVCSFFHAVFGDVTTQGLKKDILVIELDFSTTGIYPSNKFIEHTHNHILFIIVFSDVVKLQRFVWNDDVNSDPSDQTIFDSGFVKCESTYMG